MTLSALQRYISPATKAEIFQVERGGDGHVTVYFFCTDPNTRQLLNFAIVCDGADEIRVWPSTFCRLSVERLAQAAKKGAVVRFDDMYIIGHGFRSIDIPMGG